MFYFSSNNKGKHEGAMEIKYVGKKRFYSKEHDALLFGKVYIPINIIYLFLLNNYLNNFFFYGFLISTLPI